EAVVCRYCHRDLTSQQSGLRLAPFAWGLSVFGVVLAAVFLLAFDTSVAVEDGTHRIVNLGLMADRQNGILFSGLLALLGAAAGIGVRRAVVPRRTLLIIVGSVVATLLILFQVFVGFANLWVWFVLKVLG